MEFIIVAPLMLILISMILQFAQIWIAREITAYAAYCACRSVLSARNNGEADNAAQCAAEMACSWMALAGLGKNFDERPTGSVEEVNLRPYGSLYGEMTEGDPDPDKGIAKVNRDDGDPYGEEIQIPGFGTIPGSDSARVRVKTKVLKYGGSDGVACVSVQFKFPLLMPLAGRIIAWTARKGMEHEDFDYGHHTLTEGGSSGWKGQTTVMKDDGTLEDLPDGGDWGDGENHRFPVICLTEACVLPMSYSGANLQPCEVFQNRHVPRHKEDK